MKILCIIPARSGSKGIKNKNIIDYKGKPLIAWSIEQAIKSKYDMKIIVSSDSDEYIQISKKYGAEAPFKRPLSISQDLSTDFECINHAVNWLNENEQYIPDIILQLRPTSPERSIQDIDAAIEIFIKNRDNYDSLRSVIPIDKSPYKMYTVDNIHLEPLFKKYNDIDEPYNEPRQKLPQCYLHNGYIDILNTSILKNNTITGNKIFPYIMNNSNNIDIDYYHDLK